MSETATTVDTIDAVLNEGDELTVNDESTSTDTVEAEVVSDTTEEEAPQPAKRTRKSRAQRNSEANGQAQAEVQEVPQPQPVAEVSSFNRREANSLTKKLASSVQTSVELFVEAYRGRIWLALDYPTWAEYLNAELGEVRPRLPKAQRLELVAGMKDQAKMSQGAIADALGVDQKTVSNDLREIREAAAASGESVDHDESVGRDGVTRGRSEQRRGKPFVEKVTTAFNKLDKAWGDLVELRSEPEWTEEAQAIANRHVASDLLRLIHEAQAMVDLLPEPSHETVSGETGADEGESNEEQDED